MTNGPITGLNHITLAVRDLERALGFYRDVLGLRLRALWPSGAYLEAGSLWLCLSLDDQTGGERPDYTHIALDVAQQDFATLAVRLRSSARIWKENRSEGASLYLLDPDDHKLEIHAGSLQTRLAGYRANPRPDMQIFD